jgi:hypothetical protein
VTVASIRLDHKGIEQMLKSGEVAAVVHDWAEAIAADVIAPEGAEVVVDDYETDRAASSITVKHAAALAYQARYGMLTRAAARAGLEVRERE